MITLVTPHETKLMDKLRMCSEALRDSTEQCRVYRDALEKTGRDIGNLLALIHRDGGHYEAVHGRDMALDEAGRIVGSFNSAVDQWAVDYNEMNLERDALREDAERYRWLKGSALREWEREYFEAFVVGRLDEAIDANKVISAMERKS